LASSTNLISGLSSGFDWRSMVDQLIAIDHRQVDLVANKKTDYANKLVEWQGVNSKLLALKTSASALGAEDAFKVFKDRRVQSVHGGDRYYGITRNV
jgi:flagellar hook-associated protein 2